MKEGRRGSSAWQYLCPSDGRPASGDREASPVRASVWFRESAAGALRPRFHHTLRRKPWAEGTRNSQGLACSIVTPVFSTSCNAPVKVKSRPILGRMLSFVEDDRPHPETAVVKTFIPVPIGAVRESESSHRVQPRSGWRGSPGRSGLHVPISPPDGLDRPAPSDLRRQPPPRYASRGPGGTPCRPRKR